MRGAVFRHRVSLPPSENSLTGVAGRGRYRVRFATPEYVAWLLLEAPLLATALRRDRCGQRRPIVPPPDGERWALIGEVFLAPRSRLDAHNAEKATFDLLSGAVPEALPKRRDSYKIVYVPGGGLWTDDRCLKWHQWSEVTRGERHDPHIALEAWRI